MIAGGNTKHGSNCAAAVTELRRLICDGILPAGSDHLESELALRLGMSRTPVREAVLVLAEKGLLTVRPRKGVRVLPISIDDMAEIYDVLTELESLAAGDAARRGYSAAQLLALSDTTDCMDAALVENDLGAWARADDDFHAELMRLGGNGRVQSIVAMMSDQVRRARAVTLHIRPVPTRSNVDHRGVLGAIMHGNAADAAAIHRRHRVEAKAILLDLLRRHRLLSV